jgi:hypothetical protein
VTKLKAQEVFLEDAGTFFWNAIKLCAFPNFKDCISFGMSQGFFINSSQQGFDFSLHMSSMASHTSHAL